VKSLELYREISRVDPEYKSRIVGFRIEDLQAKLAKLPPAEGTQAPAAPAETNAEDYKQLYISAKEENVQLSTRLLGVEKRGVELERSLRERDQILEVQRQELVAVNRQLKEGLGESSQEIARLKRDLQDLRKFNGLLQERATELEQGFQANQAALDKTKDDYAAKDLDLQKLPVGIGSSSKDLLISWSKETNLLRSLYGSSKESGLSLYLASIRFCSISPLFAPFIKALIRFSCAIKASVRAEDTAA
jgi:hypothetical protein